MSDTDNTTPEPVEATVNAGLEPKVYSEDYVKQLRQEAAKYRTEKNDAINAAKAEITASFESQIAEKNTAFSDLEGQLGAAGVELTKLRTALQLQVPSDKVLAFAELLKGNTPEEIQQSAASAKELFGGFKTPATDPTQGTGGAVPLNGDPILAALKKAVGAT